MKEAKIWLAALAAVIVIGTAHAQRLSNDPKEALIRDLGKVGEHAGRLPRDVKGVFDAETGELLGFVSEQGGRFTGFVVDRAADVGGGVGGFFDGLGRNVSSIKEGIGSFFNGVGTAVDRHNPGFRKVGKDFNDLGTAVRALLDHTGETKDAAVGDARKAIGGGISELGRAIAGEEPESKVEAAPDSAKGVEAWECQSDGAWYSDGRCYAPQGTCNLEGARREEDSCRPGQWKQTSCECR